MKRFSHIVLLCALIIFSGCNKQDDATEKASAVEKSGDKVNAPATSSEKANDGAKNSGQGSAVKLGTAKIGGFEVKAARDAGDLTPGGDAPIDVWLSGPIEKVKAVRFWIGTEKGLESIKAKADIENSNEPNHWHTHAELPNPMPENSKLWVEIETDEAETIGSFVLK